MSLTSDGESRYAPDPLITTLGAVESGAATGADRADRSHLPRTFLQVPHTGRCGKSELGKRVGASLHLVRSAGCIVGRLTRPSSVLLRGQEQIGARGPSSSLLERAPALVSVLLTRGELALSACRSATGSGASQVLDFQSRAGRRPAPVNQVHKKKAPRKTYVLCRPVLLVTRPLGASTSADLAGTMFPGGGAYQTYAPPSSLLGGSDGTHAGQGRFLQGSPLAAWMNLLLGGVRGAALLTAAAV